MTYDGVTTEVEKEDPSRVSNNMIWTVPGVHIAGHLVFPVRDCT